MKIILRMENNDAVVREWEAFLTQARQLGATDETMVAQAFEEDNHHDSNGFEIELEKGEGTRPDQVVLPVRLVHNLLYVATRVADGDGDARDLVGPAKETMNQVNEHYRGIALGPNLWAPEE